MGNKAGEFTNAVPVLLPEIGGGIGADKNHSHPFPGDFAPVDQGIDHFQQTVGPETAVEQAGKYQGEPAGSDGRPFPSGLRRPVPGVKAHI